MLNDNNITRSQLIGLPILDTYFNKTEMLLILLRGSRGSQ